MAQRLLLIGGEDSDLGTLLRASFFHTDTLPAREANNGDFSAYSAVAFLGGAHPEGITLLPPARRALAAARRRGLRVLAEYSLVTDEVSFANPVLTQRTRTVCFSAAFPGLEAGEILDEQWNERLPVQHVRPGRHPILQYEERPDGFYCVPSLPEEAPRRFALWQEEENLIICAFRLQRFASARFSPRRPWCALIAGLISWLGGDCAPESVRQRMDAFCRLTGPQSYERAVERAAKWFSAAGLLVREGGAPYAVQEGVSSRIPPSGEICLNRQLRTDCTGETAWFFLLKALWSGGRVDWDTADGLYRMVRDMQVEEGPHRGFVRGSLGWWGSASYQDDTARGFLLPLLLRKLVTGGKEDDARLRLALDYLLLTTCADGLRPNHVEYLTPDSEEILITQSVRREGKWRYTPLTPTTLSALAAAPAGSPSAHYNAYYLGALALAGRLLGEKRYLDAACRGLASLMAAYPNTAREHSQTQECCRLILPLALLYFATGEEKHRGWLVQAAEDLERQAHPSGGYLEWDEGYTGACSRSLSGECGVYAHNGDPVCDCLYSVNWLPQGFGVAYLVTGEERFLNRWEQVARFAAAAQLSSPEPALDGGWARAVDAERMEIHGVNNDVDWSCWTLESGWTVAEMGAGLLIGLLRGPLARCFGKREPIEK